MAAAQSRAKLSPATTQTPEDSYGNGTRSGLPSHSTSLKATEDDEVHDLIGVGFGPASLAIAVALDGVEPLDENHAFFSPKVRFIERQKQFQWHAGMLLPGAKMQISFIKDLATLRDPRSRFTFLNYLKEHDRLVQFTNLGTFLPSRLEFEDYLRWAAEHFAHVVDYGFDVDQIKPVKHGRGDIFDCLEVHSRDVATGKMATRLAKNVVIAVGGKAWRPPMFPSYHDRIIHSSEYSTRICQVLPSRSGSYKIAVIGGGQSAGEVFSDLQTRYPNSATRLIFRDTALRPSDDSPFVNEVFNPEAVDSFYDQPDELRKKRITANKATNYGVVRMELLEKIYENQYMQSIEQPHQHLWQHQILPSREVTVVGASDDSLTVKLTLRGLGNSGRPESLVVDAVVMATGYRRDAHLEMLEGCHILNKSKNSDWRIGRDYGLELDRSVVADSVSIWLQGCNERTHGLADSLLSILATRSGELVDSIFGKRRAIIDQ